MNKLVIFSIFLSLCLFSGCATYSPGTGNSSPITNLYISPVVNDSYAPQAQAILSKQLRSNFLNSTINLVSKQQANYFMEVTICDYNSDEASPRTLTVNVNLASQDGTKILDNEKITESIDINSDLNSFEEISYQSMPILTKKIADHIYNIVVARW